MIHLISSPAAWGLAEQIAPQTAPQSNDSCEVRSAKPRRCIRKAASGRSRSGFTLIECLAAILLMAMVLPAINLGIAAATRSGGQARSRTEAAGLAQSKVSELVAFAQSHQLSETSLEGDFGPDWPNYHWKAVVNDWTNDPYPVGMQQLDVQVTWPLKNPTDSVTLSTLVYVRPLSN
jgi:prepilin-type N-terminal cleavage/methylation domain-containing protein